MKEVVDESVVIGIFFDMVKYVAVIAFPVSR